VIERRVTDMPVAVDRRRGRPPQPEREKLRPVTINIRPEDFDRACDLARSRREPVAVTLRELALAALRASRESIDLAGF
jgi:hypothetical protein